MTALPHIEAPSGELPIQLAELVIEASISGLYAETTHTMVFFNPNPRPLEGSLVFPLPQAAVVCGYALDVDGHMVDGVVLPKQEARRILEAEIRKGVDPGLVEHVAGNLYRTRVYPLPPGGTRRVRITYVSELTTDGSAAAYHLPLPEAPCAVQLDLEVYAPVTPECDGPDLQATGGRWAGRRVYAPGGKSLDVLIRLPDLPERFSLVEETTDGEVFFCVSSRISESSQQPWDPRHLAVLWDASGSRLEREREVTLLRQLGNQWRHTPADLVVVRERSEEPRRFPDLLQLADFLEQVVCDGATALHDFDWTLSPAEAWLIFSDGLDTVGGESGWPTRPVFTFTSQAHYEEGWLNQLADSSGGRFIHLGQTSTERAAALLAAGPQSGSSLASQGASDVHVLRSHGRVQVVGKFAPDASEVVVHGIALERPLGQPAGQLLARVWAGRQALRIRGQDTLLQLARRYGVVTPGASLLVLESLEQYLTYDLEPPESLPALRQAFQAQRQEQQSSRARDLQEKLDRVASMWARRREWWEKDFRPDWEQTPPASLNDESLTVCGGIRAMAPPAARSMAAPSPMCSSEVMGLDLDLGMDLSMDLDSPCEAAFDEGGGGGPGGPPAEVTVSKQRAAPVAPTVSIQAWEPDMPYLAALRGATDLYQAYLRERPNYLNSPSFFLDCADFLLRQGLKTEGLRVLSNLSELALDDPALMRIQAWRLQQSDELDGAIHILERVLALRPDEPQSHRDLALALGDRFQRDGRPDDAERAVELLYQVAQRTWDRFPEIELIALMELNRLIEMGTRRGLALGQHVDPRLLGCLDLDLRISLAWDADLTDVDLHVYEPTAEHAYYGHQNTRIGGLVSRDFRDGYGPEEYVLRRAYPGSYAIKAHYYGSHQQTLTGACTVLATVFTNYARPDESRQFLTLRLDEPRQEVAVGEVTF